MHARWIAGLSLFCLVFVCLLPQAHAQNDIHALCYEDCGKSTNSTPGYEQCVARAADKADAALNKAYAELQAAIRADGEDMRQKPTVQLDYLKAAQKQWITYRNANCTLESSLAFGGTGMGADEFSCRCALSYQRIDDFTRMRKDVMGE